MGHEPDRDNSENVNMCGYPFEENGYRCVSLTDDLYGIFLSYKIERPVYPGFARDTDFAINSVTPHVLAIQDFKVSIEERKLEYLTNNKTGKLKKAGIIKFHAEELERLIKEKISSNYIYNMTYLKEYETTKFNVVIEKYVADIDERVKLTVSLEYLYESRTLRLITMF